MKLAISRERLREKIASSPDMEFEAGVNTGGLTSISSLRIAESSDDLESVKLKEAFGFFVRQLRRREQLSVAELSEKARIEEVEVRGIEQDPRYVPRPRTIHQLSVVFKVPERSLMKLSGATKTRDSLFQEEAYRFAAKSDGMVKLSSEEQRELNRYIKFLSDHGGE